MPRMNAQRVVSDLRELAARTSTPDGAQRLAWGPVWRDAREWFKGKIAELGLRVDTDSAGNNWVTLPGASPKTVIIGSHLDSVPNGGWLDGCLGVVAGLEALRMHAGTTPPVTLRLVDWADEEGARFGRSLLGSAAAAGELKIDDVRELKDRQGTRLVDALAENGVALDRMLDAQARAEADRRAGVSRAAHRAGAGARVDAEGDRRRARHVRRRAAHAPLHRPGGALRVDADPDAARRVSRRGPDRARVPRDRPAAFEARPARASSAPSGVVNVEPKIVTAVPGVCEISLDQRALNADVLAAMLRDAKAASERAAKANNVTVEWRELWRINPRPFDPALVRLCEEAVREETGDAPRLPSGPLHDAAEMVPHMPVVMMFAYSSNGLSHCKEEDTPGPHLEASIRAYLRLVQKTIAHVGRG